MISASEGLSREGQRHRWRAGGAARGGRRIVEVATYCQEDVVNTYRIWLLHELLDGRLSAREYEASEEIMWRRGGAGSFDRLDFSFVHFSCSPTVMAAPRASPA